MGSVKGRLSGVGALYHSREGRVREGLNCPAQSGTDSQKYQQKSRANESNHCAPGNAVKEESFFE